MRTKPGWSIAPSNSMLTRTWLSRGVRCFQYHPANVHREICNLGDGGYPDLILWRGPLIVIRLAGSDNAVASVPSSGLSSSQGRKRCWFFASLSASHGSIPASWTLDTYWSLALFAVFSRSSAAFRSPPVWMVPGARIELATPAFSGRRSTTELPRLFNHLQTVKFHGVCSGVNS